MNFAITLDEAFTLHRTPPGHPERPERITSLIRRFESIPAVTRLAPCEMRPEWILRVHSEAHFERIRATAGKELDSLDLDTQTSARSFEIAGLAAGSGVRLVEALFAGKIDSGFLLARPPGHHAERERAMGFCLFNNVAVAAQWALDQGFVQRVAVVDFDVHHGNGTQEIFYERPDVLYVSSHQFPLYPGSGTLDETGAGDGEGATVNFPAPAGLGDEFMVALYGECVGPVLEEYEPGLVLVSAGYDAHRDDPLAGMSVSDEGFARITAILNQAAQRSCNGRILYFLEGGYDLRALAACAARTVEASMSPEDSLSEFAVPEEFSPYRSEVAKVFGERWKALA